MICFGQRFVVPQLPTYEHNIPFHEGYSGPLWTPGLTSYSAVSLENIQLLDLIIVMFWSLLKVEPQFLVSLNRQAPQKTIELKTFEPRP